MGSTRQGIRRCGDRRQFRNQQICRNPSSPTRFHSSEHLGSDRQSRLFVFAYQSRFLSFFLYFFFQIIPVLVFDVMVVFFTAVHTVSFLTQHDIFRSMYEVHRFQSFIVVMSASVRIYIFRRVEAEHRDGVDTWIREVTTSEK